MNTKNKTYRTIKIVQRDSTQMLLKVFLLLGQYMEGRENTKESLDSGVHLPQTVAELLCYISFFFRVRKLEKALFCISSRFYLGGGGKQRANDSGAWQLTGQMQSFLSGVAIIPM